MIRILITLLLIAVATSCNNKVMQAAYSGGDISESDVYIQRNKLTKHTSIVVNIDVKWELYSGSSVDKIDLSKPIASGDKGGVYTLSVDTLSRSYFQLVTPTGSAIISERHLPMAGGYNFRDMGGMRTSTGRYTKWGLVFRSDELGNLTNSDLTYLASLPLTTVVDFRAQSEIDQSPDKTPATVVQNYKYSITPGKLTSLDDLSDIKKGEQFMIEMNRSLVTDTVCTNQYRAFFKILQNPGSCPMMFHCSAGKDRTGMGAALFLLALGVDQQRVMDDYLLSNLYLGDKYALYIDMHPFLKPVFEVRAEYLEAGLEQIKQQYGTIDNFLEKVLEVDIELMRKMYLYE